MGDVDAEVVVVVEVEVRLIVSKVEGVASMMLM